MKKRYIYIFISTSSYYWIMKSKKRYRLKSYLEDEKHGRQRKI